MFNVSEHTKLVKGIKRDIEQTSQTPVTRVSKTLNYQPYFDSSVCILHYKPEIPYVQCFKNLTKMLGFAVHSPLGFKKLILKCDRCLFLGKSLGALLGHGNFQSDLHIQELSKNYLSGLD
jgi:hypothetical protein